MSIQISELETDQRQNSSKVVKSRLNLSQIMSLSRAKEVRESKEELEVNPRILKDLFLISHLAKSLHLRQV